MKLKNYIAYGSNLHLAQMNKRCPDATIVAKGFLKDHTLIFKGEPQNAYATVVAKKGSQVPVLLWNISEEDKKSLDVYEDYPITYTIEETTVQVGDQLMEGFLYIMNPKLDYNFPSATYVETITQGYADNGFDIEQFQLFLKENEAILNQQ